MVVKMVMRYVAEDSSGKMQCLHPALHQRMRADLHKTMGAALIHHLAQKPLKLQRIRRCMMGGKQTLPYAVLNSADKPCTVPQCSEEPVQKGDSGGFAVGAGDTHKRQPA